jgi:translation elongation factor EF-Tu-like GTPase
MSRPYRSPDAEVQFKLTSLTFEGDRKRVLSGYRPIYDIQPDYWTSVHHEFVDVDGVATGEEARAEVWFISPEAYPHSLWADRKFVVAEGSRPVATAMVLRVLNASLLRNDA